MLHNLVLPTLVAAVVSQIQLVAQAVRVAGATVATMPVKFRQTEPLTLVVVVVVGQVLRDR